MVQKAAVRCELVPRLRHATTGKLCLPSSERQQKETDGLRFSSAVPKIQ